MIYGKRNIGVYSQGRIYFANLFPDTYISYSLSRSSSLYSGDCIRVRRSIDNAETDIGFLNGVINTVVLLDFCGVGDGFVTDWYSQKNIYDLSQVSAGLQPKIVDAGSVVVSPTNGLPAIRFNANGFLTTTNWGTMNEPVTYVMVMQLANATLNGETTNVIFSGLDQTKRHQFFLYSDSTIRWTLVGSTIIAAGTDIDTEQKIAVALFNHPDSYLELNGALASASYNVATGATPVEGVTIGGRYDGIRKMNGWIQEFHIFDSNKTTEKTDMYNALNSIY